MAIDNTATTQRQPRRHQSPLKIWISFVLVMLMLAMEVARAGQAGQVKDTGRNPLELIGHSSGVSSVTFSPDGKTIAFASSDKTVKLWNIEGN